MNELLGLPFELWDFAFWIHIQILAIMCVSKLYLWMLRVISLSGKDIEIQGGTSIYLMFTLIWLDIVYTFMYII